jgi:hypothetical protein
MQQLKRLLAYVKPVHHYLPEYLIYTLLGIVFGLVNFTMLVPLLNLLFNEGPVVVPPAPQGFEFNIQSLTQHFNYKLFKVIKQELAYYRQQKLPAPRFHFDERHQRRVLACNPYKFWPRKCAGCGAQMQTTFAPDRPEKVCCETCYAAGLN